LFSYIALCFFNICAVIKRNSDIASFLHDCLVTFIGCDIFFEVDEDGIIKTFMSL